MSRRKPRRRGVRQPLAAPGIIRRPAAGVGTDHLKWGDKEWTPSEEDWWRDHLDPSEPR